MEGVSEILEKKKAEIIKVWVKEVREELRVPNITSDPVLRDHLPLLLNDIIKIVKRYENFEISSEIRNYEGMLDNSKGHGRHRASSSGYDIDQVFKEYIILHRILTRQLRQEHVYTTEVADLLKYIIENSMLYAVVTFNKSLEEIRQKLLGVLAHDIRNPLSAANLGIGILRQEDSPERFDKLRDMSKHNIKRSLDLLENILASVKVVAGEGMTMQFSEKDLMHYISSLYQDCTEIYSNEIILKCDKDKITGIFDTSMICRVLENIINNAIKYGERGTPVTITVNDFPEKVAIEIHNQGNPISEKDQKEIFKFLNTTRGTGKGGLKSWGMGLSLVNAVAQAHDGSVELVSNAKEGTTFKLIFHKNANNPGTVKTSLTIMRDY